MTQKQSLKSQVVDLGKQCAVWITGFSEDADFVKNPTIAMAAIRECIRLGIERNNELNELRLGIANEAKAAKNETANGTD